MVQTIAVSFPLSFDSFLEFVSQQRRMESIKIGVTIND